MYLKPLSTASVTTTASGPRDSARRRAPTTFAPVETPAKIPSSCASRFVISIASPSSIVHTSSTCRCSKWGGTIPVHPCMANEPVGVCPSAPLIAADPAGSSATTRMSRSCAFSAWDTPISDPAVPTPWHNALTRLPVCSHDHRERHPVLHRPGWVQVLELDPDLGAACGRERPESDEGRVPDRREDRRRRHRLRTLSRDAHHDRADVAGGRLVAANGEERALAAVAEDRIGGVPHVAARPARVWGLLVHGVRQRVGEVQLARVDDAPADVHLHVDVDGSSLVPAGIDSAEDGDAL